MQHERECSTEGCNSITGSKGRLDAQGNKTYDAKCTACKKAVRHRWPIYHIHKKDRCEKCGFIPEHPCQLDVDHIDGNKQNDDITNLMTLCANCHRLKTQQNKDFI